jgi:DNA-directed RNA polymerase specialized sigma24 family protein
VSRGEWREDARRMRAEGLTYGEIGRRLGVTTSVARRAADPELARDLDRRSNSGEARRARKTAWDREHRPSCPSCGGLMSIGADSKGVKSCRACCATAAAKRIATVIAMRNEKGLSNREISDRTGVSVPAVAQILSRARQRGVDVARDPYMTRSRELR